MLVVAGHAGDHGDGLFLGDHFAFGNRAVAAGAVGRGVEFVGEPDEFG